MPAESVETFQSLVHMPTTVMIPNVQDLVPDQTQLLRTQAQGQWNYTDDSFWANYHDLATLNNFTETLIAEYPDLVTRVSMGHTFEGREVFGMSIHGGHKRSELAEEDEDEEDEEMDLEEMIESWWSWLFGSTKKSKHNMKADHKKNKNKKKKAIVIHGGQHARGKGTHTHFTTTSLLYREWIATARKREREIKNGRAVIDLFSFSFWEMWLVRGNLHTCINHTSTPEITILTHTCL